MEKSLGINNKVDLYKRLTPALNCKSRELARYNIKVKKEEVWNYLIKNRWNTIKGLELSEMVDDILNLDNNDLIASIRANRDKKVEVDNKVANEIELL